VTNRTATASVPAPLFRNFAKSALDRNVRAGKKRKPTTDAIEIIHRRHYEGRPQRIAELVEAEANDTVARKLYALRKRAGLTQQRLAKLVGTTTSVICRLEDADYQGHSLAMLRRVANALNKRVELRFVNARSRQERRGRAAAH
jgi:DNA-binding XRE family transcriptional regulator